MAKKVKCPGCGAKNDVGQHRCRVCTKVIDPEAVEALPKGLAKQAKLDKKLAAGAAARAKRNPDADPFGGLDAAAGPGAVSVPTEIPSSWDTAPVRPAAEVGPADDPIGPVLPTAPVPLEAATPEPELAADAIVIEAAPRHLPNPTLDEPVGSADSANSWDAVGGIEIDVVSRNAAGAPPPIEHVDEGFDPDALIIDPPR